MSQAIYAMAALGVADHLTDGPRAAADLAHATGASEPHLYRLLRALASEGVLIEDADGRFSLSEAAGLLATGSGLREMVLGWSVLPAGYAAFGRLADSVRSGRPAFDLTHGSDFHAYLAQNQQASAAYDAAMESTTSSFDAAAGQYPFGDFDMIVDVGGGGGGLLIAVLQRFARPRGIVFDLPSVIASRRDVLPAAIGERLDFVAGNFFEDRLPAADLYVLSTVLRVFDDDRSVELLKAIVRAMRRRAKVAVMDFVHPPGPLPSPYGLADLQAMVLYGGRDRSEAEFAELFRRAGLKLRRTMPSDPPFSILEAVL